MLVRLSPYPAEAVVRAGEAQMPLRLDDALAKAIYRGNCEAAEIALISALVRPGDVVVDVGAHLGQHTLHLASAVGRSGQVIAVEPNSQIFDRLEIATRDLPQVQVHRFAIDSEAEFATLTKPSDGNRGQANLMGRGGSEKEQVPCIALDTLLSASSVSKVAFLKVDVEGWESRVFDSAGEWLPEGRIRYILAEVSPEYADIAYVDRLLRFGYIAWAVEWVGGGLFGARGKHFLIPIKASTEIVEQVNVLFEYRGENDNLPHAT